MSLAEPASRPAGGPPDPPKLPYAPRPARRRNPVARYTHWLHTMWPAGTVEKLPAVNPDGTTNVPGLYIVGDLTGVPLLKFSADGGARAVRQIARDLTPSRASTPTGSAVGSADDPLDLVIIGAGVSGMSAALEAQKHGLRCELLEATEPFSTVVNFPARKPIYTYPSGMTPAGELQFREEVHPKETLVDDLHRQTLARGIRPRVARAERVVRRGGNLEVQLAEGGPLVARRVIVAIGRSGSFHKLNVPGEDQDKVFNRLHDPMDFAGQRCLVVGGGDSAVEAAIALAECGATVTLSYRGAAFTRPKPDNLDRLNRLLADPAADVAIEPPTRERDTPAVDDYLGRGRRPGRLELALSTRVQEIRPHEVVLLGADGSERTIPNDAVFPMIGREAPLDFFRRSGVRINGEWRWSSVASLVGVLLFCVWLYHWKKGGTILPVSEFFAARHWFPFNVTGDGWLAITLRQPGFYYSLAYSLLVAGFGVRRMKRKPTGYIKWQTATLIAIQVVPLFILPYFVLPWMGTRGWFDGGVLGWLADQLFPRVSYDYGREYWRAFGLILAWPLFIWNVFSDQPLWLWLGISFVQTFVIIPGIIYFWGKGAYCGWICSCGALAETLGDAHRHKMPHGPFWNRLNMAGQAILLFAFVILFVRVIGWLGVDAGAQAYRWLLSEVPVLNYAYSVDLVLAGIIGVGLYFHFSGRVWCRFFCPLAALMHVYHRFSRFRILVDKKRCISCNVCTSVCHQGIDVMNFANKGVPMADPQCVRCSACVQSCPTGVLWFGQVDRRTEQEIKSDPAWLWSSPVRHAEITVNGRPVASRQGR